MILNSVIDNCSEIVLIVKENTEDKSGTAGTETSRAWSINLPSKKVENSDGIVYHNKSVHI